MTKTCHALHHVHPALHQFSLHAIAHSDGAPQDESAHRLPVQSDRYIRQACPAFSRFSLDLKDYAVLRTSMLRQRQRSQACAMPQGQMVQAGCPEKLDAADAQPGQHSKTGEPSDACGHGRGRGGQGACGVGTCGPTAQGSMGLPAEVDPPEWIAVGKHLCGAATDFALRGCLPAPVLQPSGTGSAAVCARHGSGRGEEGLEGKGGQGSGAGSCAGGAHTESSRPVQGSTQGGGGAGARGCQGDGHVEAVLFKGPGMAQDEADVLRRLRGLAIATCCHHRCVCVRACVYAHACLGCASTHT